MDQLAGAGDVDPRVHIQEPNMPPVQNVPEPEDRVQGGLINHPGGQENPRPDVAHQPEEDVQRRMVEQFNRRIDGGYGYPAQYPYHERRLDDEGPPLMDDAVILNRPHDQQRRGYDDEAMAGAQNIRQQDRQWVNARLEEIQRRLEEQERRQALERQIEELSRQLRETRNNTRNPVMKPSKFQLGKDNFCNFLSGFKIFARAANIPREREIENLLCCLDEKAQRRVETLRLTEEELKNPGMCYEKLSEILSGSEARAQAKMLLFDMKQDKGESVTDFATRLIDRADLAYGSEDDGLKDRLLLEIFMRGLYDDRVAYDLLKEQQDDFDSAYKQALGLEGIYNVRKTTTAVRKESGMRTFGGSADEIFTVCNRDEIQYSPTIRENAESFGLLGDRNQSYQGVPQFSRPRESQPLVQENWNSLDRYDRRDSRRRDDMQNSRTQPIVTNNSLEGGYVASCRHCGRTNHRTEDCRACFNCGNSGHWARECSQGRRGNPMRNSWGNTHYRGSGRSRGNGNRPSGQDRGRYNGSNEAYQNNEVRYPYHDVAYNSQMSRIQENGSTDVQGSGSSYQNEDVEYNNRLRDILGGQNMDQRNMGQQVHYPSNNTNQVRQNPIPTMTDRRNDRNPISNYGLMGHMPGRSDSKKTGGKLVTV